MILLRSHGSHPEPEKFAVLQWIVFLVNQTNIMNQWIVFVIFHEAWIVNQCESESLSSNAWIIKSESTSLMKMLVQRWLMQQQSRGFVQHQSQTFCATPKSGILCNTKPHHFVQHQSQTFCATRKSTLFCNKKKSLIFVMKKL